MKMIIIYSDILRRCNEYAEEEEGWERKAKAFYIIKPFFLYSLFASFISPFMVHIILRKPEKNYISFNVHIWIAEIKKIEI